MTTSLKNKPLNLSFLKMSHSFSGGGLCEGEQIHSTSSQNHRVTFQFCQIFQRNLKTFFEYVLWLKMFETVCVMC